MTWLALDSCSSSGSIALEQDGVLRHLSYFDISVTHSETLMPQIDAALKFCNLPPNEISGIITTIGPGSFTGLRIGLATAKGIAFANQIPLLTYSSLQLIAANCYGSDLPVLVCLDAKMKELYAALYTPELLEINSPCVIKVEELVSMIDQPVLLVGNATDKVMPLLAEKGIEYRIALSHQNLPIASALFSLKRLLPQSEVYDFETLAKLEPQYLRESTAQIKFHQKQQV
jgi:tRNA threonylcarbamoyladenosine biosynthesis protein TsaB